MTTPDHIQNFSKALIKILSAELKLGNKIDETSKGYPSENTIIIFLKEPFIDKYDFENIVFREINDPHYWKSEYYDKSTEHILACKYGQSIWNP